jgi:glycosyltransferase involved in cell wall biosynthesis
MKTVAHVLRRFTFDKWGGTETVVFNFARELQNAKINSPVYCTNMFSRTGTEHADGVPIHRYRYCFPWLGLTREAKQRLRLKGGSPLALGLFFALLKNRNLSLIHTHVQHRLGGMARTVARLKGIPYVVSIHGGHFALPSEQVSQMTAPFKGKFEWGKAFGFLFGARRVLHDAAAIICVGLDEYQLAREHYPNKPVYYLPNGVHVKRFHQADPNLFRDAYGFQPHEKLVVCVSRIDYQKNQKLLVESFTTFAATHPDHRLVLIGPVTVESYHQELLRTIEQNGLTDRVSIITGLNPNDPKLPSAVKAADLFVLPTVHEPFGIVILEAWAAGVPVVATRTGGIPGFTTDEKNILLFEKNDRDMLTTQMNRAATAHSQSDDTSALREHLIRHADQEVRSKYDWTQITDQLLKIYDAVS